MLSWVEHAKLYNHGQGITGFPQALEIMENLENHK